MFTLIFYFNLFLIIYIFALGIFTFLPFCKVYFPVSSVWLAAAWLLAQGMSLSFSLILFSLLPRFLYFILSAASPTYTSSA